MSLAGVAKETLEIVQRGTYQSKTGKAVELKADFEYAIENTKLYYPNPLKRLLEARQALRTQEAKPPTIEVTAETTAEASRRLIEVEKETKVVALNFASAKNPGGGFIGGAKAQEEDLARCSALYNCQLTRREYYDANRVCDTLLYTDHIIYSPEVPFFRDERLDLLEAPFLVSVITAPAPNAGEFLRRERGGLDKVRTALERRAGMVLCVAAEEGHRVLVLGAWGCGVFRNNPSDVARAFSYWLTSPAFAGAFDRVVFGIYSRDKRNPTLQTFREELLEDSSL